MMAGLQRSATTFRRSGSSGLVWDERFLTEDAEAKGAAAAAAAAAAGDGAGEPQPELRHSRSVGSIGLMRRAAADGGDKRAKQRKKKGGQKEEEEEKHNNLQVFRTKDVAPDVDPPSPRVSGCILCAVFRSSGHSSSSASAAARRAKPRKK